MCPQGGSGDAKCAGYVAHEDDQRVARSYRTSEAGNNGGVFALRQNQSYLPGVHVFEQWGVIAVGLDFRFRYSQVRNKNDQLQTKG